jgi:hypothetical protein
VTPGNPNAAQVSYASNYLNGGLGSMLLLATGLFGLTLRRRGLARPVYQVAASDPLPEPGHYTSRNPWPVSFNLTGSCLNRQDHT